MHSIDLTALLIIFSVALGTYFLRASGILLSSKITKSKNLNLFLDSLPATLLISLIFPSIINQGVIGVISALGVILTMYKTKNIFLAMVVGMLFISLYRNFLG